MAGSVTPGGVASSGAGGQVGVEGPRSSWRGGHWHALQSAAGIVVALALWELAAVVLIDSTSFPSMTATLSALVGLTGTSAFWAAIGHTLEGAAIGLAIATAIAVPLGLLIGFNEVLYRALRPVIEFLRPVPSVALIPLAILVYGTGLQSKVFLVAFAATWPLLMQTLYGVRDMDPVQLETARSYRIGRRRRALQVMLPAAIPYIATGMRIAAATALILAVTAELIIGTAGLGRSINLARSGAVVDDMYALIITSGILGVILNTGLAAVERRVLRWHPSHRERAA